MYPTLDNDTICAISTPRGVGGIAVIRISGQDAISITDKIWQGIPLANAKTHTAHLGYIIDPQEPDDEPLDQCVATLFKGPNSFTGEDVIEISVHGSKWIQRELINLLIRTGCRLAEPGEFTRRAFASGKLDLAQAEAVADVIASSSKSAHRLASSQMRGAFSQHISALRDHLIKMASLLELELDFSEEDVEFASREELTELAMTLQEKIGKLTKSFSTGHALKDGVPVAIVGEPNVGKSTLLNQLLNDSRAIVSEIPGTTRDTIEDTIEIDNVLYRFIDTAGIRETDDTVENMGIQRTLAAVTKARIIIWMITPDASISAIRTIAGDISKHIPSDSQLIIAVNKIDRFGEDFSREELSEAVLSLFPAPTPLLYVSAFDGTGMDTLLSTLHEYSGADEASEADIMVTNARHYEALVHAGDSLQRVLQGIAAGISGDFIAQDLRETIHHLGTITGTITTTDLLHSIFKNFCIGK